MSKSHTKFKRLVVISDLHCGHEYGLTPPDWWDREDAKNPNVVKVAMFQRDLWGFYEQTIKALQPIHTLIVNGDCIDGKGERSGGMELITADRHEQIRMAHDAIKRAKAEKGRILYGTRYHVGRDEDFESMLASLIGGDVRVKGHEWPNINGLTFDIKHKVGGSAIPHGRMTAIARARLWNVMWWADMERQPKANVYIRSHVHYHQYCGGPGWIGMTTPALCYNSSFGIRECEGLVDVGVISFDIAADGSYKWRLHSAEFASMKAQSEVL